MILEIIIGLLIFFLGFQLPRLFNIGSKNLIILNWLWCYHLMFGLIYYFLTLSQGGNDTTKYWEGAKHISSNEALQSLFLDKGTRAMYAINYLPSNLFSLSFFTGAILYSLIGFLGLVFFYNIVNKLIPYNPKINSLYLIPAIFYFPNLHFWSCAIGKDTLLFFCIGLFAYSLLNLNKRILLIILSLLLAYIVRPHISLFLVLAFSLAYLLNNKIATYKRVFLFVVLFGIGLIMLPSVMEYSKIENLSTVNFEQFAEKGIRNLSRSRTGSRVDMSSYPLPIKVFTFLYRPTFFDIKNVLGLLAAIENLILLILSINVLKRKPLETFEKAPFVIKGFLIFLFLGTVAFSMSLGNLGIMLRMRNMFLPGMLIYICWSYSYYYMNRIRIKSYSGTKIFRDL